MLLFHGFYACSSSVIFCLLTWIMLFSPLTTQVSDRCLLSSCQSFVHTATIHSTFLSFLDHTTTLNGALVLALGPTEGPLLYQTYTLCVPTARCRWYMTEFPSQMTRNPFQRHVSSRLDATGWQWLWIFMRELSVARQRRVVERSACHHLWRSVLYLHTRHQSPRHQVTWPDSRDTETCCLTTLRGVHCVS